MPTKPNKEIDMKKIRIINLRTPVDLSEPTTKRYVNNNFINIFKNRGMFSDLNMRSNRIKNVGHPVKPSDVATKEYVDKLVSSLFIESKILNLFTK